MAELTPIKVLLVNAGGPGAPGIIRSLRTQKERTLTILGVDVNPDNAARALLDGFWVSPRTDTEAFLPFIHDLCKRERVEVIVPLSSVGIDLFRKLADETESPRVIVSSSFSLEHTLNKKTFYEFLIRNDLAQFIPAHRSVATPDEFKIALDELGFPDKRLCFKPEEGKGGRGFRILTDGPAPFDHHLDEKAAGVGFVDAATLFNHPQTPAVFRPVLVMEYLSGKEYSVDILCNRGEPLFAVPRTREAVQSGIVTRGVVENVPALREAAAAIAKALKGDFLLNIQFRYAAEGALKVLEVNPRISGTIVHATCAGVNFPYLAIKQALGESFELPEPVWGTHFARGFFEAYSVSEDAWRLL